MNLGLCYLAGPMHGYPKFNFPAFRANSALLRSRGLDIISPHEIDEENGLFEDTPVAELTKERVSVLLRWDMEALSRCQTIILMKGWQQSSGAKLELTVAERIGCQVFVLDDVTLELVPLRATATGYRTEITVL